MDDDERLCALMEPCADKPFLDSFHNIGLSFMQSSYTSYAM